MSGFSIFVSDVIFCLRHLFLHLYSPQQQWMTGTHGILKNKTKQTKKPLHFCGTYRVKHDETTATNDIFWQIQKHPG